MPNEPLEYSPPTAPIGRNRWWKVLLRMLAGAAAGIVSCVLGFYLGSYTGSAFLMLLPFLVLFGLATYLAIAQRRHGYMAGLILAPFLTAAAAVLLLIIICSHMKV